MTAHKYVNSGTRSFIVGATIAMFATWSIAATHTWQPKRQILSDGTVILPTVIITGTSIDWGDGGWDFGFDDSVSTAPTNGSSQGIAIAQAKIKALSLANACQNPALSSAAKSTTSESDVTQRWLTANEMAAQVDLQHLWSSYQQAYGSSGITLIIDSKSYMGFKVTYVDGSTETWAVTPNHYFTQMKLFDFPAPNSLTAPSPANACNHG